MIHGRQFEFIYKFITNNEGIAYNVNNVKNILKYVTNNNNKKMINNIKESNEENNIKHMYENVNIFFKELYEENLIKLNTIYKNALLLNKRKKGIYSYSCPLEEIENNVIKCSIYLTGNFPIAQTTLYCNNSTSEEEIISFIYKCIKCELNLLFILIKPEILDIEKKNILIQLLKDLYSKEPLQMNSSLLIVYQNVNENEKSDIIIEIEKLPNHNYFNYENQRFENNKFPNVEVYSSDFSGLGKSTLIKNHFEKELSNKDYIYIYFPIGGDFNRSEIIERLLLLSDKKIALHLDLYESDNIELIREFLFSFIILKYYSQKENIFFYGDEIRIKIEIPNSFISFLNSFPILNFFKKINITQNKMPELIVSKEVSSN
jgi:hypothetical protein